MGMKNKLSHSAKSITCPSVPRDESFLLYFYFSIYFQSSNWKNKETVLPETSMIARKWADFPERLKWWKAWCLVKGRILWESLWGAKGQHSREAASAKCRLEGVREEWDTHSLRISNFLPHFSPDLSIFSMSVWELHCHTAPWWIKGTVWLPTNKILEKPIVTSIPATNPPQIHRQKLAEGWQPH